MQIWGTGTLLSSNEMSAFVEHVCQIEEILVVVVGVALDGGSGGYGIGW